MWYTTRVVSEKIGGKTATVAGFGRFLIDFVWYTTQSCVEYVLHTYTTHTPSPLLARGGVWCVNTTRFFIALEGASLPEFADEDPEEPDKEDDQTHGFHRDYFGIQD